MAKQTQRREEKHMPDVKIIVAAHKLYDMPADRIYLPVHVGSEGKDPLPYQLDNEGENISAKNPGYCELTGLYWAWKNLDCDYLGLVHYRRHFTVRSAAYRRKHTPMECVLSGRELRVLIPKYSIIVPKKRRYYIETLYSHYAHTHYGEHLELTRQIIAEKHPDDLAAFDYVMNQTSGYMFNMFIMEKSLSDAYCVWLFDILGELETRMAGHEYSAYQGRFYGRVSEILFNVWLEGRTEAVKEIGYLPMEKEDCNRKIRSLLAAQLYHRKYGKSF